MPELVLHARHEAERLRLRTNLDTVDPCDLPAVFSALAAHLGLDPEIMHKAVTPTGGEGPDPRYPALQVLIRKARRDWDGAGQKLVAAVRELLDAGKLLPLTAENEAALLELFRDHRVTITARFAGHVDDLPRLRELVRAGLVADPVKSPSVIDLAYRLGRGLRMLETHRIPTGDPPSLEEIIRQALAVELTPRDRVAMAYAQRRAAVFMRRPADQATNGVHRALTLAELGAFRRATSAAIERAEGSRQLARALRDAASEVAGHPTADREAVRRDGARAVSVEVQEAMAERTLQNDMDRVARTELHFAHAHGAYEALRDQCAEAGIKSPEVYKLAAPGACADCRRIWGPIEAPRHYALSYIEEREAAGGNFGLSRSEWGPVIGPVHPNCTEAALQLWDQALVSSIHDAAREILATYRR